MLNSVLWTPLVFGILLLVVPRRFAGWWAVLGTAVTLGIAIALLAGFDTGSSGMQDTVDVNWIPGLGVDYSLGVDGINIFLVVLTALVWLPATAFAAFRDQDRPKFYFALMLLAETATLGAFLAQDLLLFVLFFDLMLVPFYFLFGIWGSEVDGKTAFRSTLKMFIYTLVGSLLMLVGAVAIAVLSNTSSDGITFSLSALQDGTLAHGSQQWIFWLFAAAFLVKMPAFLVHGWMRDTYSSAPLPALAVFSGVLSKVGAYGFIRIVLPILPDASVDYQTVILVLAVAAILYGSVMAFTQSNIRLVAGYSSIAQLGFITAGVFTLQVDGLNGSLLQMVTHGLVVVPMFLIIAILYERSGTTDMRKMGGMATRAPVLAAIFLIISMATLAMPATANFVGEFYVLNGLFQTKAVFAYIGIIGVVLAAFYSLRLYQQTMHNRGGEGLVSREIGLRDAICVVPLVVCIIALSFYPQFILKRTDTAVPATVSAVAAGSLPKLAEDSGEAGYAPLSQESKQ